MINEINYSNGYIEIYSGHCYAYNYKKDKGQIFVLYSISQIKRIMNLK
jgi:hypothetical protein